MVKSDSVSKAIKESKWLDISYENKNGENTSFWISIEDIDFEKRSFRVNEFNINKTPHIRTDALVYFDKIKEAKIIELSCYDREDKLINKIENNLSLCSWLRYDHFDHNVLNYYTECNLLDNDPSQKEYECIPGIDLYTLRKEKTFKLNDEQEKRIVGDIYHYDIHNTSSSYYTLVINSLSIDKGKDKFVIAYYPIYFNPIEKSLTLDEDLHFNSSFLIEGTPHSLFNYINMDIDKFTSTFKENYIEYKETILSSLRPGETLDTRPDIMLLSHRSEAPLDETYSAIEEKYSSGNLSTPLKSFFGNITKKNNLRRKEPSIVIYDKRINIDQMRVLYNAMKYPVTFVQGPPGSGKTQTIINVVLSAFFSDRTTLVCSSNNKPVDGIIEKLKFEYNGEKINFPYLRLGNYDEVKKSTLRIKELFEYKTNKVPKEELLKKIKVRADDNNSSLIEMLNRQEKRVEIQNCIESSKRLIASFGENSSEIIDTIKSKISSLERDLKDYKEITNEELVSLFVPLNENRALSQFLYFKSLEYINKLKLPRYQKLIEICSKSDDDERASSFNAWLSDNNNMKLLNDVFPIIFSTNISSRKLGSPKYMFSLVIMDESGQANAAEALLPIAKAESLLLVGDPNQLKPVILLEDKENKRLMKKYNIKKEYNYKTNSILSVMRENDNISKYILLRYHYRCGRKIISYPNERYYNSSLDLSNIKNDGEVELLNVKNQNVKNRNEAYDEGKAIIDYIKRNNLKDAYIVTPFRNQNELLKTLLKANNIKDVDCGTIHSLQGAEKDTIILSPAISEKTSRKTFDWLKNNHEVINVAVTRAKKKLVIAADEEVIDKLSGKDDDLYTLLSYVKNNGNIVVPPSESVKIELGLSNGSIHEDEFFKTISQFCSCNKNFEAERNVKLSKLFNDLQYGKKEFDLVLYEIKDHLPRRPVLAFEVNGGEHLGIREREESDMKKANICKKYNIHLIMIPNSFVKEYEYIADIINSSKNKNESIEHSLFDDI